MAGQPQTDWLTFDVTNLASTETGPPEPYEQYIFDLNEPFDLDVTFDGSGQGWRNMCDGEEEYEVMFYAEGIGSAAPEIDFTPAETGNLTAGDYGPYTVSHTVAAGIDTEGVYKIAGVVTFPTEIGVLGFYDQLLIQVHERESS